MVLELLIIGVCAYIAVIDQLSKRIPNRLNLVLLVLNIMFYIVHPNIINIIQASFLFALLFVRERFIGGGDLKMVVALCVGLGYTVVINSFAFCSIYLMLAYLLKQKNKEIPLGIPIFLATVYTLYIGNVFIH